MPELLVSVVIPVYNGERFLEAALASVAAQDYAPLEVIVVDDGSEDRSGEIANRWPVRYIRQSNQGVAAARNVGIGAAAGEAIAFLDQDDEWLPAKLTRQVGYLLEHPEAGFALCRIQNFLEPGTERPRWMKQVWLDAPEAGYFPSAYLVRREIFDAVGMFDVSLRSGNDLDWLLRAKDAGIAGHMLEDVLVRRRVHDANGSGDYPLVKSDFFKALHASITRRRAQAERGAARG
jgi:glycosyltransferase involved in cell wall biosynthesis